MIRALILITLTFLAGCSVLDAKSPFEDGRPIVSEGANIKDVPLDPSYLVPKGDSKPFDRAIVRPPTLKTA